MTTNIVYVYNTNYNIYTYLCIMADYKLIFKLHIDCAIILKP